MKSRPTRPTVRRARRRLPRPHVGMRKNDGGDSIGFDNPGYLSQRCARRLSNPRPTQKSGDFFLARFSIDLLFLWSRLVSTNKLWVEDGAKRSLQPHIKEVRQIRVLDGVIVRRVNYDSIELVVIERESLGVASKNRRGSRARSLSSAVLLIRSNECGPPISRRPSPANGWVST